VGPAARHPVAAPPPAPGRTLDQHRDAVAGRLDLRDLDPLAHRDALGQELAADHLGQLGIVLGQNRAEIEQGHRRAQPPVRLGQLAADRPGAEHDQMGWRRAVLEDRLVGVVGHRGQAGDRRHRRPAAGRNHEAARPHPVRPGHDLGRAGEAGARAQHGHAQPLKASLAVMGRDRRDHAMDMVMGAGEVDRRLMAVHAEPAGLADRLAGMAGGEQSLGRHAADIQAVAAHLASLDQHGARAELAGAGGDRQPGRACADHAQVSLQQRPLVLHHAPPVSRNHASGAQARCLRRKRQPTLVPPTADNKRGIGTRAAGSDKAVLGQAAPTLPAVQHGQVVIEMDQVGPCAAGEAA
jgi:hypothetical protein